jgi:glycosyltransferase involved in cell wall biosynthesis
MTKPEHLKILHVLSQRPDSTGSGIYVQAMIREASDHGHENYLVAGVRSDQPTKPACLPDDQCRLVKFHEEDVSYHIPGMSDVMPYESTRFCDLSTQELDEYETAFTEKLENAVDSFAPDIIHSHHLWIISALARRLFPEIPLVTTCHGSDLRQFENCSHLQAVVLAGCRGINTVMALSQAQKNDIIRLYRFAPENVAVVGAGYNDGLFYPTSKPEPDPVQLVYAGKLSNAKGVPWLLRALSTLDSPAWNLHLIGGGSGEEKDACLELASQLGDRVIVHGALPQEKLADIMRQSHILVLPSFYEGLPLVVLEGLASGCRIIATDLPGIREVLGNVKADFIRLVETPRLHRLDQPYPEDEDRFEQTLSETLSEQIRAAAGQPQIDTTPIEKKIASFSWTGVFEKVRNIYLKNIL